MRPNRRTATALCIVLAAAPTNAFAQDLSGTRPIMPDACYLMPQPDVEALYPGSPVVSKGPTLSPIARGPQYAENCMYSARLPSATSQATVARFFSLTVVKFGGDKPGDAAETFASMRDMKQKIAADPKITLKVEPAPGVGDEAFAETRSGAVAVTARKGDLIFVVSADIHADDTRRNAEALAAQAASRWQEGVGMVDRREAVARNAATAVPPDTRKRAVAGVEAWPDACALVTGEDMRAVFIDATVKPPRATTGRIRLESRETREEPLPKPIGCQYDVVRKPAEAAGKATFQQAQVAVKNVAATPELSKKFYDVSTRVLGPLSPVDGLGDEAGVDNYNRVSVRKGLIAIEVKVTGGERDQALYADARRRAVDLARIAAARLP